MFDNPFTMSTNDKTFGTVLSFAQNVINVLEDYLKNSSTNEKQEHMFRRLLTEHGFRDLCPSLEGHPSKKKRNERLNTYLKNPDQEKAFIYQPNGSQQPPDFLVMINVGGRLFSIKMEMKSSKSYNIMLNDSFWDDQTLYVFCVKQGCVKAMRKFIMLGKELYTKADVEKFQKSREHKEKWNKMEMKTIHPNATLSCPLRSVVSKNMRHLCSQPCSNLWKDYIMAFMCHVDEDWMRST